MKVIYENDSNQRIDIYLSQKLEKSRNQIQNLIKDGYILVNNQTVSKKYQLVLNDQIQISFPEVKTQTGIKGEIDIIFENQDFLAINKPANLSVHNDINLNQDKTLVDLLIGNQIQLSSIGAPIRPGIVHRLDKNTSGIVLIAKNDAAHQELSQLFSDKKIVKTYYCLVQNVPNTLNGTINSPIRRHHQERTKMSISSDSKAKPAVTHFQVLKNFKYLDTYYSYLKVNIETGRTHQIRVHMQAIGHPIAGDQKYGNQKTNQEFQKLGLNRQFLHAASLEFSFKDQDHKIQTPLPSKLESILTQITEI